MNKGTVTALTLGLLIVLLFVVSLFYGTVHFTPAEVWQALLGHDTTSTATNTANDRSHLDPGKGE